MAKPVVVSEPESVVLTETVEVVLLYTKDLSVFKVGVNRPIDVKRVADIARDVCERKNMLSAYPVVVNERMEVIDGQHRIKAAQAAGVGVYYIVAPGLDVTDQAKANELTKSWTTLDWAGFWASRVDEPNHAQYARLLELHAEFPLVGFSTLVNFTQYGGWSRENGKQDFKVGRFEIKDEPAAITLATWYSDFRKSGLPNGGPLASAVVMLYRNPDYDHDWMARRLLQYRSQVTACTNSREYLLSFQSLYNFDRPRRNRVYLAAA